MNRNHTIENSVHFINYSNFVTLGSASLTVVVCSSVMLVTVVCLLVGNGIRKHYYPRRRRSAAMRELTENELDSHSQSADEVRKSGTEITNGLEDLQPFEDSENNRTEITNGLEDLQPFEDLENNSGPKDDDTRDSNYNPLWYACKDVTDFLEDEA